MKITTDCIVCIFNQALRVTKVLDLDKEVAKDILNIAAKDLQTFSYDLTPPQNATPMYQHIARYLNKEDIYKEIKLRSIKQAKKLKNRAKKLLQESNSDFETACKIAVVGNVIDLASEYIFDLESELDKVMQSRFEIDDTQLLKEKLESAKTLVYLADNAGENIFDEIFIRYIKEEFKIDDIYYFVRSKPIINDLCIDDISKSDEINTLAKVIESGVKTPGIVIDDLNADAREIFESASLVISKGMGNYECLSEYEKENIFFLLKVKCSVVAESLNSKIGAIICKKS